MDTDIINAQQIVNIITSSTTAYMTQFSPIFILMGGIILAVVVVEILINVFTPPDIVIPSFDHGKADELKSFYSKHGKTDARWDWDSMHDL